MTAVTGEVRKEKFDNSTTLRSEE